MQNILVVVDMQNDFIDGALGTKEAIAIVPNVKKKIEEFEETIIYTQDTHYENYLDTQEGKNLPVVHCIKGSTGWQIREELLCKEEYYCIEKPTFGSETLGNMLVELNEENPISSITFIGLCTDICVISNAMLVKAFLPEVKLIVDASCCAGVSVETHNNALAAMKVCQIEVIND